MINRTQITREAVTLLSLALFILGATSAFAAPTTMVDLGVASPYAVLSGASVGNTVSAPGAPHTTIRGDLGIKADTAPLGFPPGVVTGTIRHGSSVDPAHADAVIAYNEIKDRTGGTVIPGALLGAVLSPGLYKIEGAASNTGTVTLDGKGDPDAVFVFQVNGALAFAAGSKVVLTNKAQASRVFWQVNGAGAVGALGAFAGTLIATDAVAMGNGTFVNGRAIALNGALTLDNNQFYSAPPVITISGGEIAYTTDTTPTLFGTTDLDVPGVVTVTINGETLTANPSNGIWTVTSGILPNGVYLVEASGLDAAGNPASAIQLLTIDTVLPVLTLDALDGEQDVTTNHSAATVSGTSDVAVDTVVLVTIVSQNLDIYLLKALVHGDESWNVRAPSLADGIYQVTASVKDPAGNETTATQFITIDSTDPAVSITGGPNGLTNDATPTLTGFANVPPGTTVEVLVANQTLTALVDENQLWSVTSGALSDGVYRFIVIVIDAAGNRTQVEHLLTIDAVAPFVSIDDLVPAISGLAVTPRRVPMSGRDKNSLGKLGPMISFILSETATIQFRLTQKISKTSSFAVQGREGAHMIRIPRSIRKSLAIGGHRITAMAIDSSAQTSSIEQAGFRVVR